MSKLFIANAQGFYGGHRVRKGEKFRAADDFKAKWADEVEAEPKKAPAKRAANKANKSEDDKSDEKDLA